jgi:hypothetical protein
MFVLYNYIYIYVTHHDFILTSSTLWIKYINLTEALKMFL